VSEILEQVNKVHREVGKSGPPTVLLRRGYDAAIEDIWQACTDPERISRWFLPVSGDLRLGGHYQLEGNAGGEILECDSPRLLRISWGMGDGEASEVRVRLSAIDADHTEFELEHSRCGDPAQWARFGPGSVGVGWDGMLFGLQAHVAGVQLTADWVDSPESKELMTASADAWVAAHEAAGASAADAAAAGRQTLAFYVPQPS
jgi:uncharacterized protein YndB with AHSA1/START domain